MSEMKPISEKPATPAVAAVAVKAPRRFKTIHNIRTIKGPPIKRGDIVTEDQIAEQALSVDTLIKRGTLVDPSAPDLAPPMPPKIQVPPRRYPKNVSPFARSQ